MMTTVYLNGKYISKDEATISVMDRGFLFGDGVYEVIPVYNKKVFRPKPHIDRLYRSLDDIKLSIDTKPQDWEKIFNELLDRNSHLGPNQSIYLQVTRGYMPERNHAFPSKVLPTIFVYTFPLKTTPLETLSKGMKVITLDDTRWKLCNIKATSLLANVLLYQQALDQGRVESILIRDGNVIEGSTSNVFIVKNGVIKTPPLSNFILGGITRELVLELAKTQQIAHQEIEISEQELLDADEVWITSSTREIYPIIQVNDISINQGMPGQIWHKMIKSYHNYIKSL